MLFLQHPATNAAGEGVDLTTHQHLTRRERQIMDVVYARGQVTVSEVLEEMPDAPTYSAVRAMMRKLEEKGHLVHDAQGARYVYAATMPREAARENALHRLVRTFFDGSPSKTVAALLDMEGEQLTTDELDDLARLIEDAKRKGR
jgi:predicted transcriptional regulator